MEESAAESCVYLVRPPHTLLSYLPFRLPILPTLQSPPLPHTGVYDRAVTSMQILGVLQWVVVICTLLSYCAYARDMWALGTCAPPLLAAAPGGGGGGLKAPSPPPMWGSHKMGATWKDHGHAA